jgi:hypothetical protein
MQSSVLEITVKVRTSALKSTYAVSGTGMMSFNSEGRSSTSGGSNSLWHSRRQSGSIGSGSGGVPEPCCGSRFIPYSNGNTELTSLVSLPNNERMASYSIKVTNARASDFYPPSRIGDLHIAVLLDTQLTLTLTAPGDDFDQKAVSKYQVWYRRSFDSKAVLKEQIPSEDIQAGSQVNLTINLPSHGLFYIHVAGVDPHGNRGKDSNVVQVKAEPPPSEPGYNTGSSESQVDNPSGKKNSEGKLSSTEIALIIVGVIAFIVLLAVLIVLCVYCRRRAAKGMGSTETKISTISDTPNKAPIHWSASQLLSEHEKRQSMYAPSSHSAASQSQQGSYPPSHHGGGGGGTGSNLGSAGGDVVNNKHHNQQHSHNNMIGHYNGSPGSSTRSFRSISDNARKTSMDYESCSSDPTLRSAKGGGGVPTDYDTPIESDQENYRTIDSYSAVPPYRLSNGGGYHQHSNFNYNNIPRSGSGLPPPLPNGNLSGSHMQYNPNIQGSLTSVNSKARRNITMV